jgi:hypothetical protein
MTDLTDEEKIAWLWNKVDLLTADLEHSEAQCKRLEEENSRLTSTATQLSNEVAIMGVELNSARTAAHDAVRDYIATKE